MILFEYGIEIGRVDRRHLLCRTLNADRRQMDESADASQTSRETPSTDSSSWSARYSPIGCGASKPGNRTADEERTTACMVRVVTVGGSRRSTRMRPRIVSTRTGTSPSCQYIRGQRQVVIPGSNEATFHAGPAPCIRYREFGGEWRPLTPREPDRPSQRVLHMRLNCVSNKVYGLLISETDLEIAWPANQNAGR